MSKQQKTEDDSLALYVNEAVNFIYSILDKLPEAEKFGIALKLRSRAADLLSDYSLSVSNLSFGGNEYEWSSVHRNAFSLKTLYEFSVSQEFISPNNKFEKDINKIITESNTKFYEAKKRSEKMNEKGLTTWNQKYKQWTDMREKNSK
jgi:hypothetical protein